MTDKTKAIRCVIVRSQAVPHLLSIRLMGHPGSVKTDALDLRRALTQTFEEGDVVTIARVGQPEE